MYELLPDFNCPLCPRLKAFIDENRKKFPDKYNAPVPSFGERHAALLIVGLAPGLKGANFTGRPFTGDYAGETLYGAMLKFGFANGVYQAHKDDGFTPMNARVTNAVKCVPPQNKVMGQEINSCMPFLRKEISHMPRLRVILSLGLVSHNTVLKACGEKQSAFPFAHGKAHNLSGGLLLVDSYHCSRYNTNTGRLTQSMFEEVFTLIKTFLDNENERTG